MSVSGEVVIGVDIGGTFTDCIVIDGEGRVTIGKAPSTPPDFQTGFVDSIASAADRLGLGLDDLVARARGIYHGCTVGTNALVEGRTAPVGLLTTRGHADSLGTMSAGSRLWGMPPSYLARVAHQEKPEPLVPRALIGELDERVAADGAVVVELNEERCREEVRRLAGAGAEAFAISLLWSVVNPAHERRVAEIVAEEAPGAFVSVGSEVIARSGEYQRTVATVINALIGPVMDAYLAEVEASLAAHGYTRTLHVMSCSGGLIDAHRARARPLLTVGSGPVAGLIGAGALARLEGAGANGHAGPDVITGDVGGTTFDVGVIRRGQPLSRPTTRHGQYQYFVPTLDVRSIGAGGGSLIRHDPDLGTLRVGPESAGARPGPACYRRGGEEPTITDAVLVLGYLNPDYFLGGAMDLDVDAAVAALGRAGAPLGFGPEETAAAAVRIVDSQMADAIRLASVQQGYEPRNHVLYAYGGGGPAHAGAIARQLGIAKVVVPLSDLASGWSAFGVVSSDAVAIEEVPLAMSHPFDPDRLNETWALLEQRALAAMERQGIARDDVVLERESDLRYAAQVNQVQVPSPGGTWDEATVSGLVRSFEEEYERLFGPGSGYAAAGYGLLAARVRARARLNGFPLAPRGDGAGGDEPPRRPDRGVILYEEGPERRPTRVYDGSGFLPGMRVEGPAIVEFPDTTLVVRRGQRASVDARGSVAVDVEA